MAIDVNHQLRINYLLRNGARAIRVAICENLGNNGKIHEKQAIHDIYNAHSFYLEQEIQILIKDLIITIHGFTTPNDDIFRIFPAKHLVSMKIEKWHISYGYLRKCSYTKI